MPETEKAGNRQKERASEGWPKSLEELAPFEYKSFGRFITYERSGRKDSFLLLPNDAVLPSGLQPDFLEKLKEKLKEENKEENKEEKIWLKVEVMSAFEHARLMISPSRATYPAVDLRNLRLPRNRTKNSDPMELFEAWLKEHKIVFLREERRADDRDLLYGCFCLALLQSHETPALLEKLGGQRIALPVDQNQELGCRYTLFHEKNRKPAPARFHIWMCPAESIPNFYVQQDRADPARAHRAKPRNIREDELFAGSKDKKIRFFTTYGSSSEKKLKDRTLPDKALFADFDAALKRPIERALEIIRKGMEQALPFKLS